MKKWGTAVFLSVILHLLVISILPERQPLSSFQPKPQQLNLVLNAPNQVETNRVKKEMEPKTKPIPKEARRTPQPVRREPIPKEKKETQPNRTTVKKTTSNKEPATKKASNFIENDQKGKEEAVKGKNESVEENGARDPSQNEATASGESVRQPPIRELEHLQVKQRVTPLYPVMSRKREEEGTVYLLVLIEGGRVTRVKVEKSSGYARLDQSAESAIKKWRFSSEEEPIRARIPIVFKLKE